MSIVEDMGDALAKTTLEAMDHIDDDRFYDKVAVGASSPTLQEAFMTAIRVRLADQRARDFIAKAVASAKVAG
ncbi:hypothetical protein [Pseudorhodobacter aquimaris]|uniref:hypothetical protein n=1 Tax=Pseudorhodobacter aquimaris TaxID=687412 RepID=UPI00067DFE23|nr:hypothetical protein [Pseudorhodobacter aquimaris]